MRGWWTVAVVPVLAGLLAGCGAAREEGSEGAAAQRPAAGGTASATPTRPEPARPEVALPTGPATAPGLDATAPAGRTFSAGRLHATLLPESAFGRGLERGEVHTMPFESTREQRRARWSYCLDSGADPAWLGPDAYRGTTASANASWVDRGHAPPRGHIVVTQSLVSLRPDAARALHRVEQDILRHCPEFASDMEAGTATERYRAEPLAGLGDEAYLEVQDIDYEGDTTTTYTAHVRVGGVLVRVTSGEGADRDATVGWAARLAREVGGGLYGVGP
ncbi:hypothetical protein ABII15_25660 [Streptomyces sp. HUAS MG91]|uniref:PknH-like extracellular domain-containing protein n=1 Tax=Streptomyces tabacisoli TaxID=3156398 RepID=A0AAU8IYQ1_9ACTN